MSTTDNLTFFSHTLTDMFASMNCLFAICALLVYDYFLTLDREVIHIWHSKRSIATTLFYISRYAGVIAPALVIYDFFQGPDSKLACDVLVRLLQVLELLIVASAAIFAAMRIYAIYNCNVLCLITVLIIGLASPAITVYTLIIVDPTVNNTPVKFPKWECGYEVKAGVHGYYSAVIAARGAAVAADATVLCLTYLATRKACNIARQLGHTLPLTSILIRDGSIYFIVLLIINIVSLGRLEDFIDVMIVYNAALSSIVMCRLMLDLREAASQDGYSAPVHSVIFRDISSGDLDSMTDDSTWVGGESGTP